MQTNKLKYVKTVKIGRDNRDCEIYMFRPKLFRWYYTDYPEYEKITFSHAARMFLEMVGKGGYCVYYLISEDNVIGYGVVARGGKRLVCSKPEDIVLGPLLIVPQYRGFGYGSALVQILLHEIDVPYEYAYEYIKPTNIPSIKAAEANGLSVVGKGKVQRGPTQKIVSAEDGEYLVFRCKKQTNGDAL